MVKFFCFFKFSLRKAFQVISIKRLMHLGLALLYPERQKLSLDPENIVHNI